MLFSSPVFLFLFLPLTLLLSALVPRQLKNYILLIASLLFYAWGGIYFMLLMLVSVFINYFFGLKVDKYKNNLKRKKKYMFWGVFLNLFLLGIFKYTNFIVHSINDLLAFTNIGSIPQTSIQLPIGISFFTFQAMSYMIDVYRNETVVQKKFSNLALYVSLFPQLIAGPIVRYHDVALQIERRNVNLDKFKSGIQRFIIGLARKVLIANTFAAIVDDIFATPYQNLSIEAAWLGVIAYSIQIYYDFSGYSDMAIGLGRMFGFEFLENFNFPYISKSIKEFWSRWHISLSTWFRDYLYIPMGGNKNGRFNTYRNLLIVFFITGLWHGASWNFIIWGLFHGFFMIIERIGFGKILIKLPAFFSHIYTLLIIMIGWTLFRSENLTDSVYYFNAMFGLNEIAGNSINLKIYMNNETYIAFIFAVLGSTPFFMYIYNKFKSLSATFSYKTNIVLSNIYELLSSSFLMILLFICSLYLIANTYNPFIYFRF